MSKISWSKFAIIISLLVVINNIFQNKYYKEKYGVIAQDVVFYYSYLPSFFIYNDMTLNYGNVLDKETEDYYVWYTTGPKNQRIIKTTIGVAYLYMPFFLIAHQYAKISTYESNGFTLPYKFAIQFAGVFYLLLGLIFLRKFLLSFFKDSIVGIVLLLIVLGTNLFNYSTYEGGMSHVYSFFLYSLFLYLLRKLELFQRSKHLVLIGIILALMILIRPTNILAILIFLFWNVKSLDDLRKKIAYLFINYKAIGLALLGAFVIFLPQFLYWKFISGSWIYYSYTSEENFFFTDPKIWKGIFGFQKGWLIYTPIMLFSIIGIFSKSIKIKKYRTAIIFFLTIQLYIIFSWWCWWYGGSFGMRPMIDFYPLLAFPLCVFIENVFSSPIRKTITIIGTLFFICLNLFQTWQYREIILHYDGMTKDTYFLIWGKTVQPEGYWETLNIPDYEAAKKGVR